MAENEKTKLSLNISMEELNARKKKHNTSVIVETKKKRHESVDSQVVEPVAPKRTENQPSQQSTVNVRPSSNNTKFKKTEDTLTTSERERRLQVLQRAREIDDKPSVAHVSFNPILKEETSGNTEAPTVQKPVEKTEERPKVFNKDATVKVKTTSDFADKNAKTEVSKRTLVREVEQRKWNVHRLVINENDEYEESSRSRSLASFKRHQQKKKKIIVEAPKVLREITIPEKITVQDLAGRMAERSVVVIKELMKLGMMVTANEFIDADVAELIVTTLGHKPVRVSESDIEENIRGSAGSIEEQKPRMPIVTVMGHVDHGKTSLLDALRTTNVVAKEAGGITQHIGAYQVHLPDKRSITFIDTPGHAAFSEMRARGSNITDIVVLVVASDDGIMPQTIEAIKHAQSAGAAIVVAINKIDKPGANPQKVRTDLLQHGIIVEEMGGEVMTVEVSATKRMNLDKLLETILLQAEIMELKANPDKNPVATVIESRYVKGQGPVCTVLVKEGTLRVGDIFVAGSEWGRIRSLFDDKGNRVEYAIPSQPVEVQGFDSLPSAGDELIVVENDAKARDISEYRKQLQKNKNVFARAKTGEDMLLQIGATGKKELNVVLKSDVNGSQEAIVGSINKLENDEVRVNVLLAGVGALTESDITLAGASKALVYAFNVRANPQARELAKRNRIDIRYHSIIYNLLDDVKGALSGLLEPEYRENFLGYAEVRQVFNITKVGKIAGCMVTEGIIKRSCKVRVLRDNIVIHEGTLSQLKRFKDDAKEVRESMECGVGLDHFNDIKVGDKIECFEQEVIARTL